jgi:hypothetical protein
MLLATVCAGRSLFAQEAAPPAPAGPAIDPSPDTLTDAHVLAAMERGLKLLIKDLDKKLAEIKEIPADERFDPKKGRDYGELMLVAYALLHVGNDLKDERLQFHTPRVTALIDVLTRVDSEATYTTSLQALALAQLPQTQEVKRAMGRTAAKLNEGRGKAGGYSYGLTRGNDVYDQSNSQYGLLGMWAASDWGVAAPGAYWKATDDFWRAQQRPDGGWSYSTIAAALPSTASMTAAGVASLYVCDEFLNRTPSLKPREDPAIEKGMAALLKDFDPKSADFYYLYGVERVGLASGHKFFNRKDWYREIAVNILKRQKPDGSFTAMYPGENPERNTCYALLLLARGRAPILMNKLEFNGDWNLRPRDSANVHHHLSRQLERHMNWQSVPIDVTPQQWLDAPILLITGAADPKFTPDDIDKLRQYVRAGGVILSVPQGPGTEFPDAVKGYALQMLGEQPAPETAFRELPATHPLFSVSGKMDKPPKLMGISNGVRELWIHSTVDLSATWQSRNMEDKAPWEFPVMLFSYVAGKEELKSKLQTLSVPLPEKVATREVTVVRLKHGGNWNPEPEAWPRLVKLLALDGAAEMTLKEIPATDLAGLPNTPAMVHLAGAGKLVLSPEEQKAIKAYVEAGGTLFVEAIGGNAEFSTSAATLVKEMFPPATLKLLPADYTLFKGDFTRDTVKIPEVKYRRFSAFPQGQKAPRLEYMTINKRVAVFFSGEDITSGLLGTNTWGISGYVPADSIKIARNLVLYAARNAPKPGGPQSTIQPGGTVPKGK